MTAIKQTLDLLKQVEWVDDEFGNKACPSCGAGDWYGRLVDCKLSATIHTLEAEAAKPDVSTTIAAMQAELASAREDAERWREFCKGDPIKVSIKGGFHQFGPRKDVGFAEAFSSAIDAARARAKEAA